MKPIDLSLFAENSQKIPAGFLETKLNADHAFKKREVFLTHILDSVMILQIYSWSMLMLDISVKNLIPQNLSALGPRHVLFSFTMLAIVSFSYFTASYFFNQGQTPGMKMMKKRISMRTHSFESAVSWAMYSMSLYFTFGLSVRVHESLKAKGHGSFSMQDHLYQEMMSYKTWAPVAINQPETQQELFEEFKVAA